MADAAIHGPGGWRTHCAPKPIRNIALAWVLTCRWR
jgi:hypothetical protein